MKYFTHKKSNPFNIRPPCKSVCTENGHTAVYGYGDVNADFHVIGDYPGKHGGKNTGIPFTETKSGRLLQSVLYEANFLDEEYNDEPLVYNLFLSYIHMCCTPEDRKPKEEEYNILRAFFDAELRAITADVLIPIGRKTTEYIIENYTNKSNSNINMKNLHATKIRGIGFLILPIKEPSKWKDNDRENIVSFLNNILELGYEQISDLGRFKLENDFYFVR